MSCPAGSRLGPHEIVSRLGAGGMGEVMAVDVSTNPTVTLSRPHVLFEQRHVYGGGVTIANYDVSRDGQRFVMVRADATAGRLNVVLNWFADPRRLSAASN